jgi:hypothetical protein
VDRRAFIVGGVAALAAAVVGEAQEPQSEKIGRVGILSGNSATAAAANVDGLRRGLRDLGYVEGRNVASEIRYADGKFERLPELADELVRLKFDVILTSGIPAALALKKATAMIPIVVAAAGDLVGNGLVVSDAAPGANVTGIDEVSPEASGERLTLLRQAVPFTSPVTILSSATPSTYAIQWQGKVERAIQAEQSPEPLRAWRRSCETKTIAELQDGLDRGLYREEKEAIARTILEEKRERRLEQGEVATLKQELSDLKGELRDTRWDLGRNPRLASVLAPVC